MKILVTGSAGFIAGYLVAELLEHGHTVVGIDNFSKYGPVKKSYSSHARYLFTEGDAKDVGLLKELVEDCDHVVAAAAMVGGISYFHRYAYDLLAENERILAATFDASIWANREKRLQRISVISSSMVYENADRFPSREDDARKIRPPNSTYGFQKLAAEYFCQGAFEQYGLPYTILRPFNCVGIGEKYPEKGLEGNRRLAETHVVPDLIRKCLLSDGALEILGSGAQVRHFTYGGDLARAIRISIESEKAKQEAFNLSTSTPTTVTELAQKVWRKIHPEREFRPKYTPGFEYDVQTRSPDVSKASEVLGFRATTDLDSILDEIIPWFRAELRS